MELLQTMKLRKSTRGFKKDQISDADLDMIINAGCMAPVGMGKYDKMQLTIVQNQELLERISMAASEITKRDNPLYGAPTLIIISSAKMPLDNIEYSNAACVATQMLLAATDCSVGNVYLWGAAMGIKNDEILRNDLKIPEGYSPYASVALGYPIQEINLATISEHVIKVTKI